MRPDRVIQTIACALATAVACALVGCASGAATSADASGDLALAPLDLVSPAIRGGENGLEVLWLVAHDDGEAVARALAPYIDQPVPLDAAALARWEASGLRIVRLPMDDLATLERTLSLVGIVNRQWMGWALDWREAFRGRSIDEGAPIVVDGLRRALPAGALRFLVRCWTAPAATGSVVRIELVPQLFEGVATLSRAEEIAAQAAGLPMPGFDARSEGRLFESLAIEASFEPGYAYVITSEAPGVSWRETETPRSDAHLNETGFVVEPTRTSSMIIAGPPAESPPTLGEAMLSVRSFGPNDRPARAMVILAPRAPKTYDVFAP